MSSTPYRVLARTYRPQKFDDLIGQDVLVRTLSNAFATGRIAHAFLLTGIRGIGKTTTARIIARGLNCTGVDGTGGPTTAPCGECSNCKMILNDRHVDVIEMDAASRTGVDDIRDLIDGVQYAPSAARYKVYIIDEVHMLSKNAFNALLKTLEEPPAHVKFIFATTELRKIPITIVSRCQRFDLRRIDTDMLAGHLKNICNKEQVSTDEESLRLIATAAEGSVRDSLSLLDQAIAMSSDAQGNVAIATEAVRDMLGMADKSQGLALMEHLCEARAKDAIEQLRQHVSRGTDPVLVLQDLLGLTHFLTRIRLASELADDVHYSATEQQKAKALAAGLDISALSRLWHMLLKGLQEVKLAPFPLAAAEMVLVRIAHAAGMPSPDELIRKLEKQGTPASGTPVVTTIPTRSAAPAPVMQRGNLALAAVPVAQPAPEPQAQALPLATIASFEEMAQLFAERSEPMLYSHLYNDVQPVSFEPGHVVLYPVRHLPPDVPARLGRHLQEWTGQSWRIRFADDTAGHPTLRDIATRQKEQELAYVQAHPVIARVREVFGSADILEITPTNLQGDDE